MSNTVLPTLASEFNNKAKATKSAIKSTISPIIKSLIVEYYIIK